VWSSEALTLLVASRYAALAVKTRQAYNDVLFHNETGSYYPPAYEPTQFATANLSLQTTLSVVLALDIVPVTSRDTILKALVEDVTSRQSNHLTCGLIGCRFLLESLARAGTSGASAALSVATQETYPSWGYMLAQGEGTLWEQWKGDAHDPHGSRNHIMFGGAMAWFYKGLGGIALSPEAVGWDKVRVSLLVSHMYTPYFCWCVCVCVCV
jgi:alpha-L-rhamnosidase